MSDRDDWGPDCPTAPCEGPDCPACNPVSMPGQPCAVCGSTQHFGFSCEPDPAPDLSCWCEWVHIGVGDQRVAETPGCPQHCPELDPWPDVESAPDVRAILDRMRQRCPECHLPGLSHKMDCATGRAEGLAKLREMRAAGLLPGYVPALGDAPEPPCDWDPYCTGPEGCPDHGKPRCVGCGHVADHGTSCLY